MDTSALDQYRQRARDMIGSITGDRDVAAEMEQGILEYSESFAEEENLDPGSRLYEQLYVSKAREIVDNLDPNGYLKNTALLKRVRAGDVAAKEVAKLSPQDLFPEMWQALMEEKRKKEELKFASRVQATTDAYRCRRCGSTACTFYELQTRSIDEPMSTFLTCTQCGSSWKQN